MMNKSWWLSNFNLEYINGDFNHPGKRLHKKKMKTKKVVSTGKTKQVDIGKKSIQDSNNSRNRDAFAITKANNILEDEKKAIRGSDMNRSTNPKEIEDVLIAIIDLKKTLKRRR